MKKSLHGKTIHLNIDSIVDDCSFTTIDSTMLTSRVMVHFDDLLSVVNDAQLKSALNTYKEIIKLMKRASDQRKKIAGDKLTVCISVEICTLSNDKTNHDSTLIKPEHDI